MIGAILICTAAAAVAGGTCSATDLREEKNDGSSTVYSWYCKHTSDHSQPECDPRMSFIEDKGGYYADRSHSNMEDDDKVIYLTFDAGYENGNVSKILDVLRDRDVKGAFFVLEHLIKNDTELVMRMKDEGHTVCNHTATHRDMSAVRSMKEFSDELERLARCYSEYTGCEISGFYRPPEGKFTEDNIAWAEELGYKTVMWSFAYADWDNNNQMSAEEAKNKIISGTHNGEIILLHPTSATNAEILGELIDTWRDMGFRFGELSELSGTNDAESLREK